MRQLFAKVFKGHHEGEMADRIFESEKLAMNAPMMEDYARI